MPDKRVWASYKMPLKDFIFEHTGDANYRAHKMKVQSVRNSWGFELGITDQWEVISFGKFSVSLRRLQEKYGDDLDKLLQEETLNQRQERSGVAYNYCVMQDFACASAVAAGVGVFSLAVFAGAEVFDPSSVNSKKDLVQDATE